MWWTNAFRLLSAGHDWDAVVALLIDRRTHVEMQDMNKL